MATEPEITVSSLDRQLVASRQCGEEVAEFLALFDYFLRATPEGHQVVAEIEADWQTACSRLREEKRLIGAEFSLVEWLRQLQKELLKDPSKIKVGKDNHQKTKTGRQTRPKLQKFRGI